MTFDHESFQETDVRGVGGEMPSPNVGKEDQGVRVQDGMMSIDLNATSPTSPKSAKEAAILDTTLETKNDPPKPLAGSGSDGVEVDSGVGERKENVCEIEGSSEVIAETKEGIVEEEKAVTLAHKEPKMKGILSAMGMDSSPSTETEEILVESQRPTSSTSSLTHIVSGETNDILPSPQSGKLPLVEDYIQPRFTNRSPASSFHSLRPSITEPRPVREKEIIHVDLDDIPLDGEDDDLVASRKTGKGTSSGNAAGGGILGRGFGFLQSGSNGSAIPSTSKTGTSTAPPMTRSTSSSSGFSMASGGALPTSGSTNVTAPPPSTSQPMRSVSTTWKSGWNALMGGAASTSASSGLALDTSGLSSLPKTAEQSPRDAAISGTLSSLNSTMYRPLNGSLPRKRGSSLIGGVSENAARRETSLQSQEELMNAEDFGEGLSEDEEDEIGRTPKGKMRSRGRHDVVEEVVDEGVVGGVDWSFWGAVMSDYEDVARQRPKDLSKAIQQGIPAVIRGTMWQLMSSSKSTDLEAKYSALLKLPSPHEKSIQKDLARTFPSHAYFQQAGGVGQENLFNVVKAYSLCDPEVGYTQGLAFIVAPLLLLMPEEEAFCVLVRLMESYDLRSHFLPEMPGLQLRLYQFDRLVEELLPVLHLHFVRIGVKSSMYASQWFMTMFSYRFPLSLVFRIYDIVFAEGIEAVFRFSLALLQINEETLLKLDFEGCLRFLQAGLFDAYKQIEPPEEDLLEEDHLGQGEWKANDFVRDAYGMRISPFMLDSYAGEHIEQTRARHAHAIEMDTLRNANRNLSSQVKGLEASLASMNNEHVDLVRQLVQSRIEKEEIESELVRYKVLYAELSHAHQEASASIPVQRNDSRASNGSTTRKLGLWA